VESVMSAQARAAMTLFEVGVSLLVVSVSITTVLLLFPVGLKAQQESRFRIVAASHAQMLVTSHLNRQNHLHFGTEGAQVHDRPYTNSTSRAPDLDNGMTIGRFSNFAPMPPAILERIDSDGDELARLVAEGSTAFYAVEGAEEFYTVEGKSEGRLIFALSGYPQQNALVYHPQMKWPYHDYYPSPRLLPWWIAPSERELLVGRCGIPEEECWTTDCDALRTGLRVHLGLDMDTASAQPPSMADLKAEYGGDNSPESLRFNARAIMLRYYAYACGVTATSAGSGPGGYWPSSVYPDPNPDVKAFQVAHAWMLAYIGFIQLNKPYDLRTPRNFLMSTMCDAPLMQFDLTNVLRDPSGPQQGLMFAWNMLSSRPIVAVGSTTYLLPVASGDRAGSTGWSLTRRFDPSERCREVVVWSVDWQSYEDFEEVPGAPHDSSLLPQMPSANSGTNWGAAPVYTTDSSAEECMPAEFPYAWRNPDRAQVTSDGGKAVYANYCRGQSAASFNTLANYLIRHGADRNRNGVFDRGPVRRSARMHATTISRFLVYDPRLYLQLR
jgi:hypothetical protein